MSGQHILERVMKRIDCINKITTCFARFVQEVEGFNSINQYHINIHAEYFLIPVLNEIFDLRLENLNSTQKKNYPGIDLADFKNRVAFQITATSSLEKVKSTLETFFNKKLNEQFDVLYIYIITQKHEKYSEEKINQLVPNGFDFKTSEHILDKDSLLQKINAISSTPKLENLTKLFEYEFTDVQIEMRSQKFIGGYLNNETEDEYPNILEITFPNQFYKAELSIDEKAITQKINDYLEKTGRKPIKKARKGTLVRRVLRDELALCSDWMLHGEYLMTFRDLNIESEPLRKVINIQTIKPVECTEYYNIDEDTNRIFKYLLRQTLLELCIQRGIEWFGKQKIFRFSNNSKKPTYKKIKWKGVKESTKTVIFEMRNKKDNHTICFRNLAFKAHFDLFDDKWFIIINPTWSFTNPGGYLTSRFEPSYMSGIKRLENNNSVYYYFRFLGYYLAYSDLFTTQYPYLNIHSAKPVSVSPRLEENKWQQITIADKVEMLSTTDLVIDTELDKTLFDL